MKRRTTLFATAVTGLPAILAASVTASAASTPRIRLSNQYGTGPLP